jgi:pimeloyl-ACP methyl ester carboxylesterase
MECFTRSDAISSQRAPVVSEEMLFLWALPLLISLLDEVSSLRNPWGLLIPSRPGYGKTPSSTGRTAEAFADALVSLLDLLHLDQVIVVRISAAGPTALQLASREPYLRSCSFRDQDRAFSMTSTISVEI